MILEVIEEFRRRYNKIIQILLMLFVFAYLLLTFLHNVHDIPSFTIITAVFLLLISALVFLWKDLTVYEYVNLAIVLLIILWFAVARFSSPFRLETVRFITMAFCGIVLASGEFRSELARLLLFLVFSFFAYYLFFVKADPNTILTSSRNYISVNMLAFSFIVYLVDYIEGKARPVIWPALATLFLSVVALGRGGIIVSFLLFVTVVIMNCSFFCKKFSQRIKNVRLYAVILIVILVILLLYLLPGFMDWYKASRFSIEGLESSRFDMWKQFFTEMTLKKAILGFEVNSLPIVAEINSYLPYKHNIHNSYLDIWAKIGIMAFPIFFITVLTALLLKKRSVFLLVLFLLLLLRSSVDIVIYMRRYDFVFFAYTFFAFGLLDTGKDKWIVKIFTKLTRGLLVSKNL